MTPSQELPHSAPVSVAPTPCLADAGMVDAQTDAVSGAQACFRSLLNAMAHPGLVHVLPELALVGLIPPAAAEGHLPLGRGTAAVLLTLLDADTRARLHGALDTRSARAWLRFHSGTQLSPDARTADFVMCRVGDLDADLWTQLTVGSDACPQSGATLVIEVPWLSNDDATPDHRGATEIELSGPGIRDTCRLWVGGLPDAFWAYRRALREDFPKGIEIVLMAGRRLAAVPRSTRVRQVGVH